MRMKEENEKSGLKLNIRKARIMASGLITSWQIGEKAKPMTDFIFLGCKITAEIDCSFGRKAMINLDSILKNRDITLLTKIHIVKAMVFSVVMYGCESCIRKAEL